MLIVLLIIIPLVAMATIVVAERSYNDNLELQQHYLRTILLNGLCVERYTNYLSYWGSNRTRRVAAQVISHLSLFIYRLDEEPIAELDSRLSLSKFLLRGASKSRGNRRALYLLLLSNLPSSDNLTQRSLSEFEGDKNRMVRFFALATKINIDKGNMLSHLANYPSLLTPFELSHLLGVLRRGNITTTYQPLLASSSYNLNLLGVAIVRAFGIESATESLLEKLQQTPYHHLRLEILYTLASMQTIECRHSIRSAVNRLSSSERQCFLRHLSSLGYSEQMIAFFVSMRERQYFHAITNSYKVKIECY